MQRKDWAARVDGLVVFRGLLQSEPLASLRAALAADAAGLTGAVAAFESALFTQGTNWTEVLLDAVLEDENLCLRTAAGGDAGPVLAARPWARRATACLPATMCLPSRMAALCRCASPIPSA